MADIPDVDLAKIGSTKFGDFEVEVVDNTVDYFKTLKASCRVRILVSASLLPKAQSPPLLLSLGRGQGHCCTWRN